MHIVSVAVESKENIKVRKTPLPNSLYTWPTLLRFRMTENLSFLDELLIAALVSFAFCLILLTTAEHTTAFVCSSLFRCCPSDDTIDDL